MVIIIISAVVAVFENTNKPLKFITTDQYTIEVINSGTAIYIFGEIALGLARDVQKIINKNHNVTNVVLESPGGVVGESRRMKNIIQANQFDTYVHNFCMSACINLFASGKNRYLIEGANLGMHKYRMTSKNLSIHDAIIKEEQFIDLRFLKKQGVTQEFIKKMFKVDSEDMWFPSYYEIISSKLIQGIKKPSSFFDGSFNPQASSIIKSSFEETKVFKILKKNEPTLYFKAISEIVTLVNNGANIKEIQQYIRQAISPIFDKRLHLSRDVELIEFYNITLEINKKLLARDPFLCVKYNSPELYGPIDISGIFSILLLIEIDETIAKTYASSYMDNDLQYDSSIAKEVFLKAFNSLGDNAKYLGKSTQLSNKKEYYGYCDASIGILDYILHLNKESTVAALRYLVSETYK